jgi:hypothetical protein
MENSSWSISWPEPYLALVFDIHVVQATAHLRRMNQPDAATNIEYIMDVAHLRRHVVVQSRLHSAVWSVGHKGRV